MSDCKEKDYIEKYLLYLSNIVEYTLYLYSYTWIVYK